MPSPSKLLRVYALILILIFLLEVDQGECWRRRRRRRSPPPAPPTPVFAYCPADVQHNTDDANGMRIVNYPTPKAPGFSVSRSAGQASGTTFSEGVHTIKYVASNTANQRAYCTFRITITVLRCPNILGSSDLFYTCTKINIAGSVCEFHCGTAFTLRGSMTLACQSNRAWSSDFPTCEDIETPWFTSCPSSFSVEADSNQTSANVSWEAPTATDNVPYSLTVYQTQGLPPGSHFSQGSHTITYEARDGLGNTAECTFTVTVRMKTCSPPLTSITNGGVTCSDSNQYNSVCTFTCNSSYEFKNGTTTTRTCQENWSGSMPACIDIEPPWFTSCPSSFSVEADSRQTSAVGSWEAPTATDNVPYSLTVYQTQGVPPGSHFSQGSHTITYEARDGQGNTAECTFTVTVREPWMSTASATTPVKTPPPGLGIELLGGVIGGAVLLIIIVVVCIVTVCRSQQHRAPVKQAYEDIASVNTIPATSSSIQVPQKCDF